MRRNSSEKRARTELLKSVRARMPLALASLVAMVVSAAATAGYAWLVGPLVRTWEGNSGVESAWGALPVPSLSVPQIVGLLLGLGLLRALSETLRTHLASKLQLGVIREFRGKLLAHVLALEPASLLAWRRGELSSRIQVEVHGVRILLHMGVGQGIRSMLVATALASVALRVDTALAIPGLLVLPFAVLLILAAARPARKLQRELFAAESAVVGRTGEAIDGAAVLRAFGATASMWESIDEASTRSEQRGVAAESWGAAAGPMVELAAALGVALVFAFAWSGRSTVDLASAGTVLVALLLMYRPLHGIAQAVFGWWSGLASLDRLDELFAASIEPAEPFPASTDEVRSLGFDGLCFDYDGRPVLRGACAAFRGGELVAITGESGAGKSTLLALLAGVLPPSAGQIAIDGQPASRSSLTAATAWMPQSPALFRDTILGNVALGVGRPDRDRALEVCQRVDAHDFISKRPQGYDGVLHEGGTDLSTGQRQRICLARALYTGAPVLLLDEPSSALDDTHQRSVIRVCIEHANQGGLVFVATHCEDFLRHADRVLELRDGTVTEWERRSEDRLLH
ncbi:MAG: ABC transporter ATP-binding protein [Deltaproteobacteria bacterium]|nr:MAG: ABC transporter ATP-binding protein [Deltaproteobacteria bacterium]